MEEIAVGNKDQGKHVENGEKYDEMWRKYRCMLTFYKEFHGLYAITWSIQGI